MAQHGIHPARLINVDPFIAPQEGADPLLRVSASDPRLPEKLEEQGIKKVDEIWATFSVPAYLKAPEKIEQLFANIDLLLATGGSARIWPLAIRDGSTKRVAQRKAALLRSLSRLMTSEKYATSLVQGDGNKGVTLHKLS